MRETCALSCAALLAWSSFQAWPVAMQNPNSFAGWALDNKLQSPRGSNGPRVLLSPSIVVFCS